MDITKLFKDIIENYDNLKYALLEAQTFDENHFGFPEIYYKIMESDRRRINAFRKTFEKFDNLKDKIVCEAGVGTLALSKYYLPYVKKAYLIEKNPALIDFIKSELQKNGWLSKVELIIDDAMQVELPEKVDFIIGETMSIFCANEYQVQIFKHLRKFLKPNGKLIPEKILNLIELGYADFENGHTHYPLLLTRHLPELLTTRKKLNTIDLYKAKQLRVRKKTSLMPLLSGKANCCFMTSRIQLTEGINFTGTDSLMPPTVKLLKKAVNLQAGNRVKLQSDFTYGSSLDEAVFEIV